jgi:hypothetical protein
VSKRTKFLLGIGVIAALVIGWQVAAFAVHDEVFELDGNAVDSPAGGLDDWINVCKKLAADPLCASATPSSSTEQAFVSEPANTAEGRATTVFTEGGSKDENDVSEWQFKGDGGLPDKDNLLHSYAALYPVGTTELLYFGADRYDNSGDAALGFWFFKSPVALNPPNATEGAFTGNHVDGDLLVISNFSNGGQVSDIFAYTWKAACGDTLPIVQDPNPTDNNPDNDCAANNLNLELEAANATCPPVGQDDACAIVNTSTTTLPWDFDDKTTRGPGSGENSALKSEFFEGGIDLGAIGLGDACFTSVLAETRSSTSTDAQLKDFTLGPFGSCGSSMTTQESVGAGSTPIEADGTNSVSDSATVSVTGSNDWGGTVQFYLCGPDTATTPTITTCAQTDANKIGSPVNVSDETPTVNSPGTTTVTSAGKYCWSAFFDSGTQGVPDATDNGAIDECFTVDPLTPTLTTTAGPDVTLGNPITDTATLTGTANKPGTPVINPTTPGGKATGTITFELYGPEPANDPNDPCGPKVFETTTPVPVTNGDGTYPDPPVSFTPTAAGTYHWKATYSGDSPNTNGTSQHNANCSEGTEEVVVTSVASSMETAQRFLPNDSATISAPQGGALAGDVDFELFASNDCSGTAIYTQNNVAVSGTSPKTVSTTNTSVLVEASTPLSWRVNYDSTNAAQRDIPASCHETSNLTITNGGTVSSP